MPVQRKGTEPVINVVPVAGRIATKPADNRNRVAAGNRVSAQGQLTLETGLPGIINIVVHPGNIRAASGRGNLNPAKLGVSRLVVSNQPVVRPVKGGVRSVPAANFYPPRLFSFTLSRFA